MVDDQVFVAYYEFLSAGTWKVKPEGQHRKACRLWNKLGEMCPELGLPIVSLPSYRQTYTPHWDELPETVQREADHWLHVMSEDADIFSEEGPIKPLSSASIDAYRFKLRQVAGALRARGWPLESIDSLSVIVEPETAKEALLFFVERKGGKPTTHVCDIAHVLIRVAEMEVHAAPGDIARLRRFRKQLGARIPHRGMRPRPKAALRQFIEPKNIELILMLPQRIYGRLRGKNRFTRAEARRMQVAVALELLLMRPIRRKNLIELRLNQHVFRVGRRTLISIPSHEVKNEVDLDYPIPRESAQLLEFYETHMLPLFGDNPMGFLFPGEKPGQPKSGEHFGRFFRKVIKEETGLDFYPHLARHFGATLYLRENPHAFEVVRQVLAHKSLSTTTGSYASLDEEAAVRAYDELILRIRDDIRKELRHD